MEAAWAVPLLYANLLAQCALFIGALWCIAFPARRIYPMQTVDVWYVLMWALFGFVFATNFVFVVVDWSSGPWSSGLRFWLAGPLVCVGGGLVLWGMRVLGTRRTSGLPAGLVADGAYLLTRNPQYVGDGLLFLGVAIASNSEVVGITHLLTAFVLWLAPFAEEPWLRQQYGEAYIEYRREVPRFL